MNEEGTPSRLNVRNRETLQRLAAVVVILTAVAGAVYFIFELERKVVDLEGRTEALEIAGTLPMPAGTMLPYAGRGGTAAFPAGWVLCGSNDTPEMNGLFLRGTNEAGRTREIVGFASHTHRAEFRSSSEVDGRRANPRQVPEGADNGRGHNWDHKHRVEGETGVAENLPPSLNVLFFCKVE